MWSQLEEPLDGKPSLLIVDDDPLIRDTLAFALGTDFEVHTCESRPQTIELLRRLARPPQLALVDLGLPPTANMPDEGFQLIADLLAYSRSTKIFVLSGQNEDMHARHARTLGASEFIAKPCSPATLKGILTRALALRAAEISRDREDDQGLVGQSPVLAKLRVQIAQFADSPFPVLIEGESGSGKDLVARSLHRMSKRADKPFLVLNCAATAPNLAEPMLFGHAKGAIAATNTSSAGYFADAQDGTVVLDEIAELPLEVQAKLLRVLEDGAYQRTGETQQRVSRARIVATTNRDLRHETRRGAFRADLYHRLSVLTLGVPSLREMERDKLALLDHFRRFYAEQSNVAPFSLDEAAERRWLAYPFLGNVRELRNIVIRLTTKHGGRRLGVEELEPELDAQSIRLGPPPAGKNGETVDEALRYLELARGFDLDAMLKAWEGAYIEAALRLTRGNVSQAAKVLGMNRTTLYSRMEAGSGEPDGSPDGPAQPKTR
jgi:DNA-binding NtrC family response regulator